MALKRPTTIIDDSLKLFVPNVPFKYDIIKHKRKSKMNWEGITIKNAGRHH